MVVVAQSEKRTTRGRPYYVCKCDCGKEKLLQAATFCTAESCGCLRQAPIGNRIVKNNGYVIVKVRNDLPSMKNYKYEHVFVMEQLLGRSLTDKETVHHKNGLRDDNRPENLELWASDHPAGQRVSDLIQWAKQILSQYGEGICPHCEA